MGLPANFGAEGDRHYNRERRKIAKAQARVPALKRKVAKLEKLVADGKKPLFGKSYEEQLEVYRKELANTEALAKKTPSRPLF